jgi:hypothetical protein
LHRRTRLKVGEHGVRIETGVLEGVGQLVEHDQTDGRIGQIAACQLTRLARR